jgi:hypothetical protein
LRLRPARAVSPRLWTRALTAGIRLLNRLPR